MNPAREARLFQRGCLAVGCLLLGLCGLAYWINKSFLWLAGGLLMVWEIVSRLKSRRDQRRLEDAFATAFHGFPRSMPTMKKSICYGYPLISVCFGTKEDMDHAFESGHLKAFRDQVIRLHGFDGFDIEKGFDETYAGWEVDFQESLKLDPSGNAWLERRLKQRALHYGGSDAGPASQCRSAT